MNYNDYDVQLLNSLENVDFHDCLVKKAEWDKNNLILYFEFIYLLKTPSDNNSVAFQQIDDAVIRFKNVKIKSSLLYDYKKAHKNALERTIKSGYHEDYKINPNEVEVCNIDILDAFNNFVICDLKVNKNSKTSNCDIFGGIYNNPLFEFSTLKMKFRYRDASIYFNHPNDETLT